MGEWSAHERTNHRVKGIYSVTNERAGLTHLVAVKSLSAKGNTPNRLARIPVYACLTVSPRTQPSALLWYVVPKCWKFPVDKGGIRGTMSFS